MMSKIFFNNFILFVTLKNIYSEVKNFIHENSYFWCFDIFFMVAILKMADLTQFSIEMQPGTRPIWRRRKNAIE